MLNSPIAHTTPTENVQEAPKLGTPCYMCIRDKMLVPIGGVPLYPTVVSFC